LKRQKNILLLRMPRKKAPKSKDVYEKAEDLPESKKKIYDSILEDFDKQVEARIEQIYSAIGAMQTQIRSKFKVALLQQSRSTRGLKVEDYYYNNSNDENLDLTVQCAKVAVSVNNIISNEVKTNAKTGKKKEPRTTTKKKSSILAQGPTTTGTRKSTRKRTAPSWLAETPLASSTLTAAALGGFSSAKPAAGRSKGHMAAQTPMITPKFDTTKPLNRTIMRTQKADEKFLMSMNGSPVYIGGGSRGRKNDQQHLIPIPVGNGKTLMIPADNPDVQPIIQNLISSCMNIMSKN